MNESEKQEEEKTEGFQLTSFDDYMTDLLAKKEEEQKELDITFDEIDDIKNGIIFHLKNLKSSIEQIDFLHAFQEKYDLKNALVQSGETFDRFLVDFAIFQETNFDILLSIQDEIKEEKADKSFLPEAFDFIFLEPEKFEKRLLKKKKIELQNLIRELNNTELILPDKILAEERKKPNVQKDITIVKDELGKGDIRLKKIKKVAPGLKDVLDRLESTRIVQISMLIYYYYRLSNEDVEIDKGLSKVFPEIGEAQKKLDELEKKLKKNDANNKSEEEIEEEKPDGKKKTE